MYFKMKHPEHGCHICYDMSEVTAHEAKGWVLVTKQAKEEAKAEEAPVEAPKRRGRPPKVVSNGDSANVD